MAEDPKLKLGSGPKPITRPKQANKPAVSAAPPPAAAPQPKSAREREADTRAAALAAPEHFDQGQLWKGVGPEEVQARRKALQSLLTNLRSRNDLADFNIATQCQTLIARMGGAEQALGLVIAARGGEGDTVLQPEEQYTALKALVNELGFGRVPPSEHQLRDMDHWLNSYIAVRAGVSKPDRDDGAFGSFLKTLAREGKAAAGAVVVGGYSGMKLADQTLNDITGGSALKLISGGRYSGNGERTSRTDFNEIWYGMEGLYHGAFDTGAD